MAVFTRDDYEFLEIRVHGEMLPPSPMEVIAPEPDDPFFEFNYQGGITIIATGDVVVKMQLLELLPSEEETKEKVKQISSSRRKRSTSLDRVKEIEGDAE